MIEATLVPPVPVEQRVQVTLSVRQAKMLREVAAQVGGPRRVERELYMAFPTHDEAVQVRNFLRELGNTVGETIGPRS